MRPLFLALSLSLLATSAFAGGYAVTTDADSGPGSLRQGILDANSGACPAPCRIDFTPQTEVRTIEPLTPLPAITAYGATIEPGASNWKVELSGKKVSSGSGLTLRCIQCRVGAMIVNGFPEHGIAVEDAKSVRLGANVIGLDPTGTVPVPNRGDGVSIVRSADVELDQNTIGGNGGHGVHIEKSEVIHLGLNSIGLQYLPQGSGDATLPNGGCGVLLRDVHTALLMINKIANNGGAGVAIAGDSSAIKLEERTWTNLIWGNGGLPIDLGFDGVTPNAPDRALNTPVLTVAETNNGFLFVQGSVSTGSPDLLVDINLFASDARNPLGTGDAKVALNAVSVKTDSAGVATFEFRFRTPVDYTGQWLSATSTSTFGTSEISGAQQVARNNLIYAVLNTNDSGAGSLRQAIVDANGGPCAANYPCRIEFHLPELASGHHTIQPLTPLPPITRSGIEIDARVSPPDPWDFRIIPPGVELNGSLCSPGPGLAIVSVSEPVVAAKIRGLAINGFTGDGILIDASGLSALDASRSIHAPYIANNFIGTDFTGKTAVPNSGAGIRVRGNLPFEHIGTYGSANRMVANLISGNGSHGAAFEGESFFELEYNRIGADIDGMPLPNGGSGVFVDRGANTHLESNTIAFNRQAGVSIIDTTPAEFNGALQNSIHSNGGLEIDLRADGLLTTAESGVPNPPEISSAVFDPATNNTTVTGTFTDPSAFSGWGPTIELATSRFPEADGRGSMESPVSSVLTERTSLGNNRYKFVATISGFFQTKGKLISATATPFAFRGWIFGQGFQYGTTSETSKAIPVAMKGCPSDAPQLLEPSGKLPFAAVTEFRWNTVAGAAAYNLWIRPVAGIPEIVENTSADSASKRLSGGAYEWFVEAVYPDCPSVMSQALRLEMMGPRRRSVR